MSKNSYRAKSYSENRSEIKPIENTPIKTQFVETELSEKPVGKPDIETPSLYTVKVTHPSLRRRAKPTTNSEIVGLITDMGEYEVIAEVGNWAKLKDNSWIMLNFCKRIKK